jgi:hypothetical protein
MLALDRRIFLNRSRALLTFLFLSAALSANAGLLGTDITLNYAFEGISSTDTISVNTGTEVQCEGWGYGNANICGILRAPTQTIDFDDFSITYNYVRVGDPTGFFLASPNAFDFQNLNFNGSIVNVILTTTSSGLNASRLTFTSNSVQLNMSDLPLGVTDSFTLRMVTNPEPSAGMMAGFGGLLLGVHQLLRRRKSK